MCSWGCLVVTMPRLGSGTPGGEALSKPAPPPVSGSLSQGPVEEGSVWYSPPHPSGGRPAGPDPEAAVEQ